MKKQKYNPNNIDLSKGKQQFQQSYVKGQFVSGDNLEFMIDILKNGGKVEIMKEGVKDTNVSFFEIRVYYVHPLSELSKTKTIRP